jgi:hypothetical protein
VMSLTTMPEPPWSVTSARCSPAAGGDEHESATGGTDVVVPGAGLGKEAGDPAAEAAADGLVETDGEWWTCAFVLLPHAARTRSVARARAGRRFLTRPRILPAGGVNGYPRDPGDGAGVDC